MTNDELKALCESNARAIAATNEGIGELKNTVDAFVRKLDDEGLKVSLNTQMIDDGLGDVEAIEEKADANALRLNTNDRQIQSLIDGANSDRQAFREQAEADRREFRDALSADRARAEADRAQWQLNFDAVQEVLQRLLLEIRSTNGEVKQLGDRVDTLEQAG